MRGPAGRRAVASGAGSTRSVTAPFPFASRIRAVLFDVGNTLMGLDHARRAEIASGAGAVCDETSMRRAEMRARPRLDHLLRAAQRSESDEIRRNYATLVVAELGAAAAQNAAANRAVEALLAVWGSLWMRPPADAVPTLDALAARGFVIGCVSNSDGRVRERLDSVGLAARMACVVDSGAEGVEKPDPRIFLRAAERVGVAPAACVYVGDFLALDVEGARAAGMQAIHYTPGLDVKEALRAVGVEA